MCPQLFNYAQIPNTKPLLNNHFSFNTIFSREKLRQPPVWVEQWHCHFPPEYVNPISCCVRPSQAFSSLLSLIWYKLSRRRTNILHKQSGWILLRRVEKFLSAEMVPNSRQKLRLYAAARYKSQYTVKNTTTCPNFFL
jgi:hypothetical protein